MGQRVRQEPDARLHVTHGHGDHFFGIKQLIETFPDVRPVATRASVEKAREQGSPAYLDSFWNPLFPGEIPQPPLFPGVLDGEVIELEDHRLEVVATGFTDTDGSTALWVPDLRLVVAGDVAYDDIHHYMAETTAETRLEWTAAIEKLRALEPAFVVVGHKNPDRADDPAILNESAAYLRDFNDLEQRMGTAEDLYGAMLALYPRRANPGALWGSAKKAKS